jgi:serine/threonine protein kinase
MSFMREPDCEPLPGYRLIEPLGSGGFGEVWKCEAPGGLFKAIKFVYGNLNSLDVEGARAEQEFKALTRIKEVRHPFVLSLERIEVAGGELLIVMELADKSLHDLYMECQTAGMVGIGRDSLLRYIRDAAEALDHMNEKHNLQHLDIKPRNLFLISDRCKVADFGLVKHLERQSASGLLGGVTPLYAPPETYSGKIASQSDQYSLAIVYQELLTGQRPFTGKNPRQLAQQHMQEEPELRTLPEPERPVVARALAKDPAKRFPNCLAFVRALFNARQPARGVQEISPTAPGEKRPKTMTDMMEDFQLDQLQGEGAEEILGAAALVATQATTSDSGESLEISQLGITMHQPQKGTLRPTLILGIGGFGRRALMELRCRFLDRFGDLSRVPLLRFVYVDSDGDAVRGAVRPTSDVAFQPHEAYHLPLQPVAHYRRRQLDQLCEWLPREKLYALPRNLKTQGSRALGRLAFTDNYLRLLARVKREIQQATHPDAIYQSVAQTGLALRDSLPRIYVLASASGGGSGFLTDLGYSLRRLLHQLRHTDSPITSLLFCGAPEDPATPRVELANLYATLTELNHFSDPAIPFTAQYGADGVRMRDEGHAPFDSVYLLTSTHRTPEARRDVVGHLGSYLFHEMTTPLGLRLDHSRKSGEDGRPGMTHFRSFGTYAVWFPRGLLMRLAARQACRRMIEDWQGEGEPTARAEVDAACARLLADPGLRPEALQARIEACAQRHLDGLAPGEALTALLGTIEEQSVQFVAQDDPGVWARQTLTRVQDWLGSGWLAHVNAGGVNTARSTGDWRKSKLSRSLEAAAQQVAEEWDQTLATAAFALMEHPGRRVAAAGGAITRLLQFCEEAAASIGNRLQQQTARADQAQEQLQSALAGCINGTGSFSLFGGRSRRLLRVFVDHLAAFARQCLSEDISGAVRHFFQLLHGRLEERLRELTFCRHRLRHLQEALDVPLPDAESSEDTHHGDDSTLSPSPLPSPEAYWEAIQQSSITRVVLPNGETDLEAAGQRFLTTLTLEHWSNLDQVLQDQVLAPLGGLQRALVGGSELMRGLGEPLVNQAASILGELLPITDVAQVILQSAEANATPETALPASFCLDAAAPLVRTDPQIPASPSRSERPPNPTLDFLLIPASEAGKHYWEEGKKSAPQLHLVTVPGQADLMFCREQSFLSVDDVQRVLQPCRAAYEEAVVTPPSSPHARTDISDWVPLNP